MRGSRLRGGVSVRKAREALTEAAVSPGYVGPGPLTPSSALTALTFDVPALVAVALAAVAYGLGVRSLRRAGRRWSGVRTAAFACGLVLVVLATCSAVGVYAHVLIWVYVLQACLLLLVAPLPMGAGAPLSLATAVPACRTASAASRLSRSRLFRLARVPGFGPLVLIAATAVLFFTPLMTSSLRSDLTGELVRAGLLLAGLLVVLPVTDEEMSLTSVAYAAALGLAFVEFLLDAVPGIVLRLQTHVLQPAYWAALHRTWGPSPLDDQRLGGAVLWFFGEAGDIPFIAALLVAWVRSDAREARAVDEALDAAERARLAAADLQSGDPSSGGLAVENETYEAGQRVRPWWETDPSVFGEARARRSGWGPPRGPRD
jgi:putative membrane protein